jgi:hypothetical protein
MKAFVLIKRLKRLNKTKRSVRFTPLSVSVVPAEIPVPGSDYFLGKFRDGVLDFHAIFTLILQTSHGLFLPQTYQFLIHSPVYNSASYFRDNTRNYYWYIKILL